MSLIRASVAHCTCQLLQPFRYVSSGANPMRSKSECVGVRESERERTLMTKTKTTTHKLKDETEQHTL